MLPLLAIGHGLITGCMLALDKDQTPYFYNTNPDEFLREITVMVFMGLVSAVITYYLYGWMTSPSPASKPKRVKTTTNELQGIAHNMRGNEPITSNMEIE